VITSLVSDHKPGLLRRVGTGFHDTQQSPHLFLVF